ncbi:MAG: transketolase [bacterium]|nr:transketolase [bacterium]
MNKSELEDLQRIALRVREHILRMSTDGGCFTGASLSCADLLVFLYSRFLNVTPETLSAPDRDYLLLSKGHDVPALYGVFAELGFLDPERLKNHLKTTDHIYWHPNRAIPGIEFHSGSLGHLLSVSIGIATDIKLREGNNRVVVVLGDGELNEGTIWEGCLTANAWKLDNLIAVVDRNHFQANIRTEELIPLEPIVDKFKAFGWNVMSVDGHDYNALDETFASWKPGTGRPTVVVASTQRGRGVPSIAERADRWFCNFTHDEVEQLIGELHGEASADLTSETLIVR